MPRDDRSCVVCRVERTATHAESVKIIVFRGASIYGRGERAPCGPPGLHTARPSRGSGGDWGPSKRTPAGGSAFNPRRRISTRALPLGRPQRHVAPNASECAGSWRRPGLGTAARCVILKRHEKREKTKVRIVGVVSASRTARCRLVAPLASISFWCESRLC